MKCCHDLIPSCRLSVPLVKKLLDVLGQIEERALLLEGLQ